MKLSELPENTFLHDYMTYMQEQETPSIYDFMCGLWCLSIAVGRETYVDRPRAPVRLNCYIILSSDSGVTRKSTSVRIATNLVRDFLLDTRNRVILVESKITTGLLEYELQEATRKHGHAHVVISASELAAVLSRGNGISGMPALLTDLYDCPDARLGGGNTSNRGHHVELKNVYASFIAGSTPTWLQRAVTPAIIEGGFTSRCYFIDGASRKRSIAWPEHDTNIDQRPRLRDHLRRINEQAASIGAIGINDAARDRFTKWYNDRVSHKDAYRASFEAREDAHVLRIAGLLCINADRWLINMDDIQNAINTVSRIKYDGQRLFTGTTIDKRDIRLVERVRTNLIASGQKGVNQTELTRAFRPTYKSEQVRNVLAVMHELDLVQKFSVDTSGRPITLWRATMFLANDEMYSQVAEKLGITEAK